MQRKIKFEGRELIFDLPTEADGSVFDEIFRDKDYRDIEADLKSANVVLDLGAHKGMFSVYASALGAKQIYAFEPAVENFLALKDHLKMNGLRNVVAKNVAVAAEKGQREFYLSEDSHNHSLFGEGSGGMVQCTDMESIFRKNRLVSVDVLKVDIEGAEFELLEGLSDELWSRIKLIFVEYHDANRTVSLEKLMKKHAFSIKKSPSVYDKNMGYMVGRRKKL